MQLILGRCQLFPGAGRFFFGQLPAELHLQPFIFARLIAVFRISYAYLSEQLGNPFVNLRCTSICENNPMHREIQSMAQQILSYYVSSSPLDRFRLQASYLDLIYLLIRFFTLADTTTAADTAQPKSDRMLSILRYLHQNYNQPITLQSLADHFYLSIPYLSKLFKKNLGLNFLKYLNKIRTSTLWRTSRPPHIQSLKSLSSTVFPAWHPLTVPSEISTGNPPQRIEKIAPRRFGGRQPAIFASIS